MLDNRGSLYQGELRYLPATAATQSLGEALRQLLAQHFGGQPRVLGPNFLPVLGEAREELATWKGPVRDFLEQLGLVAEDYWIDRIRLRGVAPGSQEIPAAAPVFYAHRDTWYANPQAQINLWMPLHSVGPENSFAFYPDLLAVPVENDSHLFDYQEFQEQAGFQSSQRNYQAVYPRCLQALPAPQPVVMKADELLLFSAAHLHQTLPNLTDLVRFSVDLRLVHRRDQASGLGAVNCDNQSRGQVLPEYTW